MRNEWLAAGTASALAPVGGVPLIRLLRRVLLLVVLCAAWPAGALRAQTAAELIEQARQCDPTYVIGPGANRSKAMELYEKALTAGIEGQPRLDTLFRMGQLYGSILDRQKGESPNYHKAIGYYQQIVESCPPEEPMVLTAIGLISDHYGALNEFDAALTWAKRAVEYDTAKAQQHIQEIHRKVDSLAQVRYTPLERQAILEQKVRSTVLQDDLQRMQEARVAGVDRLARVAQFIDPLRTHGELRTIADKYAGTSVGDRASQRLQEAMDKDASFWAPSLATPRGPAPSLQPPASAPALPTREQNGMKSASGPSIEIIAGPNAPEPNTTEKPKAAVPLAKSPRAPPLGLPSACLAAAAGLLLLGWTARKMRTKTP